MDDIFYGALVELLGKSSQFWSYLLLFVLKMSTTATDINTHTHTHCTRIYSNETRWDYANDCHAMQKYLYTHLPLTWNQMELVDSKTKRYKMKMHNWDCVIYTKHGLCNVLYLSGWIYFSASFFFLSLPFHSCFTGLIPISLFHCFPPDFRSRFVPSIVSFVSWSTFCVPFSHSICDLFCILYPLLACIVCSLHK